MQMVLVTGGAGFIGSHFLRALQRQNKGIHWVNCDALTYAGRRENVAELESDPRYSFVQADVCDIQAMRALFDRHDIDTVVHFAAESHVDRSIDDPQPFLRTNVMGTACLLEAARRAWATGTDTYRPGVRFLYISTDEVYGNLLQVTQPFRETSAEARMLPARRAQISSCRRITPPMACRC